ncbi:MAG TPA: HAD family phosphatase [Isosphaeraceae bacterium]
MKPKAVLFDFDGTLADTENVHVAAWQRTLARMGWELADEAAARAAEIDDRYFLQELFGRRKIEGADIDGWIRLKQDVAEMMLTDAPRLYPGVGELVRSLRKKGVRLAVVTTTWRRNVEVVLGASGLAEAFELIVGKEDVTSVKPSPDAYDLALRRLKIPAGEAVALEDSPTGLASARAAGVEAVAVGHRRREGEWSGGHRFLADLGSTEQALKVLGL